MLLLRTLNIFLDHSNVSDVGIGSKTHDYEMSRYDVFLKVVNVQAYSKLGVYKSAIPV